MDDTERIVFAVIIGTLVVLALIGVMCFLMVVNTNRRHRHRAELAEADLRLKHEVVRAVREATQQTLCEVGRELHDNVGQLLTVTHMGLSTAIKEGDATRLPGAHDALLMGIEEVRRMGRSLNTDLWKERSLIEAIGAEAKRIERVARVRTSVVVTGEMPDLPPDSTTILFRVFQEIMNNALKHSGTGTLTITADGTAGFALTLADSGRGFDPATVMANNGLVNIRSRCTLIGFDAQCTSSPGTGCTWHLSRIEDHGA